MQQHHKLWICVFALGSAALPQPSVVSPKGTGPVQISGSIRSRIEAWDWFQGQPDQDSSYWFSGNLLRLSLSQARENWDWQLEIAAPVLLNLPDHAIAPAPQLQLGLGGNYFGANDMSSNTAGVFAKQAFVRWKSGSHFVRLGRFEFNDGSEAIRPDATLTTLAKDRISQRLIGGFGWSHVGRSFDGVHYGWNSKRLNVTAIAFAPTRGVFQTDGWGNLHIGVLYGAITRQLGIKGNAGEARAFVIGYQDWREIVKTDNRPAASSSGDLSGLRIATFGGHYIHALTTAAGTVDGLAWGAVQTGTWGPLHHSAWAWTVEAGWQPEVLKRVRPWIRGGYSYSSGDNDPRDATHRSFFQILPTPRPYARFPFFNMMNNEDLHGSLILRPDKRVSIRTDVHGLRLSSGNDSWYQGGGAFQPWSFGYTGRPGNGNRGLATLYDASIDIEASAHVTLSGYFGRAIGHSVIRRIYPEKKDSNFGYVEASYKF